MILPFPSQGTKNRGVEAAAAATVENLNTEQALLFPLCFIFMAYFIAFEIQI